MSDNDEQTAADSSSKPSSGRYKPAALMRLTGITRSDYDAWRRQLPGAPSGHFTDGDVLGYRVVRDLIRRRVYLKILKHKDTTIIFKACNHSFHLLKDYRFVFDWQAEELLFLSSSDPNPDILAYDLLEIPLESLVSEHNSTLKEDCDVSDPTLIEEDVLALARLKKPFTEKEKEKEKNKLENVG